MQIIYHVDGDSMGRSNSVFGNSLDVPHFGSLPGRVGKGGDSPPAAADGRTEDRAHYPKRKDKRKDYY